ncbi:MAG: CheR family methyltransferase, partial [Methylococcales bacterium]|nr:CheR family methyltransferase [Methylococcales bacterium]
MNAITPEEFELFRKFMLEHAGIGMAPEKHVLVASRLAKRLNHLGLTSYGAYFRFVTAPDHQDELQIMVNLLTTNETYFFREPKHFEFLVDTVLAHWTKPDCRVWSAASSTGEEAYSLAMTLASHLRGLDWAVLASDLSTHVLDVAR